MMLSVGDDCGDMITMRRNDIDDSNSDEDDDADETADEDNDRDGTISDTMTVMNKSSK